MSWTERCGVPLGTGVPTVGGTRRFQYEAVCESALFARGATRARAYYEDCAKKLESRECSLGEPFECEPPPGELPNLSGCAHDFQCASGWCKHELIFDSELPRPSTCGICTARIEIGEPCNEARLDRCVYGAHCNQFRCDTERAVERQRCTSSRDCADGLRCEPSREFALCQQRLPAGGACARSSECAGGLVCAGDPGTGEVDADSPFDGPPLEPNAPPPTPIGICRELREGERCASKRGCLRGLGCDPDELVCVPIKYVSGDEACDDNVRRCKSGPCFHSGFLSQEPLPVFGICPIPLDDGATCNDQRCELPAVCNPRTNRCELPDPEECN